MQCKRSAEFQVKMGSTVDIPLRVALLRRLRELERTFQSGHVVVVQPYIDGMVMTNPVAPPGDDPHVVEAHLRKLLVDGLVENGGLYHPGIGIHFARLTRRGRRWLLDHAEPSAKGTASNGMAKAEREANSVASNVADEQVVSAMRPDSSNKPASGRSDLRIASELVRTFGRYSVAGTALLSDGGFRGRAVYSWQVDGCVFHGSKVFDDLLHSPEAACENALNQFEARYTAGEFNAKRG
jgi:hypothetical protein